MIAGVIISTILGIAGGTITGLVPGIHVNLVSGLASALFFSGNSIVRKIPATYFASFIISMAVTHSFLDFIPSTFLGVPDSGTEMAVLPAHRLTLNGLGNHAVFLSLAGSFLSMLATFAVIPVLIVLAEPAHMLVKGRTGIILLVAVGVMIATDFRNGKTLVVFVLSGLLGLLSLNIPGLNEPLLPLLSGLFGASVIITSIFRKTKLGKQQQITIPIELNSSVKPVLSAFTAGTLTSLMPGLGSAQGAALVSGFFKKIEGRRNYNKKYNREWLYLITVGGINTVNFIVSIVLLAETGKARNGAVVVVRSISSSSGLETGTLFVMLLASVSLIAGSFAVISGMNISRAFSRVVFKIPYKILNYILLGLIFLSVVLVSGVSGVVVLITSAALGIAAGEMNVARQHLMGCLIVPVLIFFLL